MPSLLTAKPKRDRTKVFRGVVAMHRLNLEIGEQIAALRIARGLSVAQVAELTGQQLSLVRRLETGSSATSPSLALLDKIATVLGAKIQVRFVEEPKPEPFSAQANPSSHAKPHPRAV